MKHLLERYYFLMRSFLHPGCSYLIFFVTSECNARCKMCFYWRQIEKSGERKTLTLEEIKRFARNFKFAASLSISGGEPTLREDLAEIVYYFYKYSGTRFVTFSTNGLLPERTEKIVASILSRCPALALKVYISIDHIKGKHDEIRGVRGAFGKALETFSRLNKLKEKNKNLKVFVETVLSSYNKLEIFDVIDYVKTNMRPDAHSVSLARGNTREKSAKAVTLAEYKKVTDYMKVRRGREKTLSTALLDLMMETNIKTLEHDKMILPCSAGRKTLTISDEGRVMPCEMLEQMLPGRDFVMGDLRRADYDIRKVLVSRKSREVADFIRKSKCHCAFECCTLCNIVFNPGMYPKIVKRLLV